MTRYITPARRPKPKRKAPPGHHWEASANTGKWFIQPNVIGRRPAKHPYKVTANQIAKAGATIAPQLGVRSSAKKLAKAGSTIVKKVKPAGPGGGTHVAIDHPKTITPSGGAFKANPNKKVIRSQKKGKGQVARSQQRGVRRAPRAAQGQPGAGGDPNANPYGIPEMPDFFSQVQQVPSYEDIAGGQPSVQDLMSMVQGGGGGGNYTTSGYSSPGTTTTVPGTPGGTSPVANNVNSLAQNLTGALGGTANQGTADALAAANAISEGIPSSFPTAGTAGYSTSTGGYSSGGSSSGGGRSINPYTAAASLQKMYQAEQMFGPKLMAQFLKNQGYSIKNAKDYQNAWMDAALFGPKYSYAVGKAKGQTLRNNATALSTQVVRALAGPKIAKAGVDLKRSGASLKSTNVSTNIRIKKDQRQAQMDQARYNKTIAEINKVNKTKPAAQRVNIGLSKIAGHAVDSAGHRINAPADVQKAFAKGPTGTGKKNTYGLTPSTFASIVPMSTVAIKHMHKKGMTYQKAINALMGGVLGTGKAVPQALAVKLVNQIYKPGGQGRKK